MIRIFAFLTLIFFYPPILAETVLNKLCYSKNDSKPSSKAIKLNLYIYTDNDLQKEIGALAEYDNSKNFINLVLDGKEPTKDERDSYERGDENQLTESIRYEVIKGKITGMYSSVIYGHGNQYGEYVLYKNLKTNKKTTFQKYTCE